MQRRRRSGKAERHTKNPIGAREVNAVLGDSAATAPQRLLRKAFRHSAPAGASTRKNGQESQKWGEMREVVAGWPLRVNVRSCMVTGRAQAGVSPPPSAGRGVVLRNA